MAVAAQSSLDVMKNIISSERVKDVRKLDVLSQIVSKSGESVRSSVTRIG